MTNTITTKDPSVYVAYDPKLEGIQKGIEVFGDMTLKQLDFIAKRVMDFITLRGCFNVCAHCMQNAKSPIQESETRMNRIAYEDFKALCDGFKELNNRLGYNIFARQQPTYLTLLYDSDSSCIYSKDENGVEHGFPEMAKMLYETTNILPIFDTASWNPKDKATQKRMEAYAMYYKTHLPLRKNIANFSFSANPFHVINVAAVKAKQRGDFAKAEEYRNIFIDRIVNALFTITPVIGKRGFKFIARALPDNTKGFEGFTMNDCFLLYIDIIKKLEEKYYEDLRSSNPKYIGAEEHIKIVIDKLHSQLRNFKPVMPVGRLLEMYQPNDPALDNIKTRRKELLKDLGSLQDPKTFGLCAIDVNGKVYLRMAADAVPTELAFNFKNKDKQTAPMGPNLVDFVFTNDILERLFS